MRSLGRTSFSRKPAVAAWRTGAVAEDTWTFSARLLSQVPTGWTDSVAFFCAGARCRSGLFFFSRVKEDKVKTHTHTHTHKRLANKFVSESVEAKSGPRTVDFAECGGWWWIWQVIIIKDVV
jgi:hypothetical protein